jgi:hypothetical protein
MRATAARLRLPTKHEEGLLANCDLVLDGHLVLRGFRLVNQDGFYKIRFPSAPIRASCDQCRAEIRHTDRFCSACGIEQQQRTPQLTAAKKIRRFLSVAYTTDVAAESNWIAAMSMCFEAMQQGRLTDTVYRIDCDEQGSPLAVEHAPSLRV